MILANFFSWCAECSIWLLPLLIGAWLLGYLLWNWTRGSKYRNEIDGLHGNVRNWKSKFNEVGNQLTESNYEKERLTGEYATLKSRFADYDTKYQSLEKKYKDAVAINGGEIDTSDLTDKISDLESQLEASNSTNLKLQSDYSDLKSSFNELQVKIQNDGPAQGIMGNHEEQTRIADLEKLLEAAKAELGESKAQVAHLNANYNSLQTDMDALVAQTQQSGGAAIDDTENYQARIEDLEKKLAIAYETNTKMEADFAHLKADYGNLEIKTQKPVNDRSEEVTGLQQRISELELLLASRSSEEDLAPGEGKKKKKKKKRKNKKEDGDGKDGKKKKKKKNKNKKKGKKKKDKRGKQGSGGGKLDYSVAFGEDNLQIVEGIGPKIEGVLKEAGISNWMALANTKTEELQQIMENAGPRYKMHDPSSWAEQASMANDGNWKKMVDFQKQLGGTVNEVTDAKVEKMYIKAMGFKTYKLDDLKVVEGVGPKIEELLKNAGIDTWEKLADSQVEDIQKVLDEAGPRYKLANPGTWAKQAKLAAEGDWHALKIYQDALKGGKE